MHKGSKSQQPTLAAALVFLAVLALSLYLGGNGSFDLGTLLSSSPSRGPTATAKPGLFDFYVLALSWSPEYCESSDAPDPQQCSLGRRLGFVLHGLWPQYNKGYPSDCSTVKLPADALHLSRNFIINIQQLKFDQAGHYAVALAVDGRVENSIPLRVHVGHAAS